MRPVARSDAVVFARHPTHDEVRTAVKAAVYVLEYREADKVIAQVLAGQRDGGSHRLSRTRAYAATALFELYDIPRKHASLLVGVSEASSGVHLSTLTKQRERRRLIKWFSDDQLYEIKKTVVMFATGSLDRLPPQHGPAPVIHILKKPVVEPQRARDPLNALGDPMPERSALATTKAWVPYEQSDACREAWAREDARRAEGA